MDYTQALSKLKALTVDGVDMAELVSAVEGKVGALEAKNYEVIGEKRSATQKTQAMQSALEAIAKAVGVEGDIDAILETAQGKVTQLASEAAQLRTDKTTLEAAKTEAEGKLQGFERKGRLGEIAAAAGANAAVLEKLLGDRLDDLKIEGDGDQRTVKLGDKLLKEHIEADADLKVFAPALFPAPAGSPPPKTEPPKTGLPSGGPKPGETSNKDPLAGYIGKTYAVPGQKQKQEAS